MNRGDGVKNQVRLKTQSQVQVYFEVGDEGFGFGISLGIRPRRQQKRDTLSSFWLSKGRMFSPFDPKMVRRKSLI
jgi:hypothetical protein